MPNFKVSRPVLAYTLPFGLFMAFLLLTSGIQGLSGDASPLWLKEPKYWVFPLQSLICFGVILYFWRDYDWGSLCPAWMGILAGLLVLVVWIAPQMWLGAPPRTDGFNPDVFADSPELYWSTVWMRFFRLVIVVPLLEEIFWRGFLMRYLIQEDFRKVPFGSVTFFSFSAVVILFSAVHSVEDFAGAIFCGLAFNVVAIMTRSLWACVIAHAVTNLGLGLYVMATKQWGFW